MKAKGIIIVASLFILALLSHVFITDLYASRPISPNITTSQLNDIYIGKLLILNGIQYFLAVLLFFLLAKELPAKGKRILASLFFIIALSLITRFLM